MKERKVYLFIRYYLSHVALQRAESNVVSAPYTFQPK